MDCMTIATWVYAVATIALFIAAIVAACIARKNLEVLREQLKYNTFLTLLKELSDRDVRRSRALVHDTFGNNKESESKKRQVLNGGGSHLKDAIEETISVLDRIGFFLLRGEPNLRKDAPEWIWEITGTISGTVYISLFYSIVFLIMSDVNARVDEPHAGGKIVSLIFLCIWSLDTFAFVFGKTIGKHAFFQFPFSPQFIPPGNRRCCLCPG